jgi:hypothetical protein
MKMTRVASTSILFVSLGMLFMSAYFPLGKNQKELFNNKPECWTDEIRQKIIRKYAQKYNMSVYVVNDSMPSGIVKRTGVGFRVNQPISKENSTSNSSRMCARLYPRNK